MAEEVNVFMKTEGNSGCCRLFQPTKSVTEFWIARVFQTSACAKLSERQKSAACIIKVKVIWVVKMTRNTTSQKQVKNRTGIRRLVQVLSAIMLTSVQTFLIC